MAYKAIFLDRDNTLIEDPGYINHPSQVTLLPGVAGALNDMRKMGYKLIIVSNQSAVARGIVTEEVLGDIHERLLELLRSEGVYLDAIYYCPFHPEGVIEKYRKESDLRKPRPGMLLMASNDMNINLSHSWMVGDTYRDIESGKRAGCRTILVNSPATPAVKEYTDPEPDCTAVNIKEAANIIKMCVRDGRMPYKVASSNPPESNKTQKPAPVSQKNKSAKAGETKKNEDTAIADRQNAVQEQVDRQDEPGAQESSESVTSKSADQYEEDTYYRQDYYEDDSEYEYDNMDRQEKMFEEILDRLNRDRRTEMFEEFSLLKVFAGIIQIIVVFCLIISIWFMLDQTRDITHVQTVIGFAIVFQLMAISFFIMDRK